MGSFREKTLSSLWACTQFEEEDVFSLQINSKVLPAKARDNLPYVFFTYAVY